jgi:bifunctional enzyme CysN/CysC
MAATESRQRRFVRAPTPLDAPPELLRVATAGSVDDGKSTLIGRLLHDTKSILEDQLEAVMRTSSERGDARLDLALLTDGLRAEREQGITIDVAYRFFSTARRSFILADTPGHVRYTRNMVTGASTAELALVLIDARQGVVQQSRRHAFIASLLRVPHIVAVVNKMDLVDFDEETFERIAGEFRAFARKWGAHDVRAIPVSALHGDNVVERSPSMPWYDGPTLLRYLEDVDVAADRVEGRHMRLPVQWVVRPHDDDHHDYRGYAGQVVGGTLRTGDEVLVLPSGERSRVAGLDTYDGPLDEAGPAMSVTVRLEDELDVRRGQILCHPDAPLTVTRELVADICWLDDERALRPGTRYLIRQTTRTTRAFVTALDHRIDIDTLEPVPAPPELELNEIGRVRLRTAEPLAVDAYAENRPTGAFIVIDEHTNGTVGAGMVVEAIAPEQEQAPRSPNVVRHVGTLTHDERFAALGHRGATLWLTGLPSSGKTTIANALEALLVREGRPAYVLDGDTLRHGLTGNLGFSPEDRAENIRRAGEAALLLADAGTLAVVSLVSPDAAARDRVRRRHEDEGVPFLEVYVDTPVEECERRDPKGLYRRARAGEITGFTGVDAPYEAPIAPDVVLRGARPVEEAVAALLAALDDHGLRGT